MEVTLEGMVTELSLVALWQALLGMVVMPLAKVMDVMLSLKAE